MFGLNLFLPIFITVINLYILKSIFFLLLYLTGSTVTDLEQAQVYIISNDVCNAPANYNGAVLPGMLCAGVPQGGVDACQVSSRQCYQCHHPSL